MPIQIQVADLRSPEVVVKVRRPAWQEFIHY